MLSCTNKYMEVTKHLHATNFVTYVYRFELYSPQELPSGGQKLT